MTAPTPRKPSYQKLWEASPHVESDLSRVWHSLLVDLSYRPNRDRSWTARFCHRGENCSRAFGDINRGRIATRKRLRPLGHLPKVPRRNREIAYQVLGRV